MSKYIFIRIFDLRIIYQITVCRQDIAFGFLKSASNDVVMHFCGCTKSRKKVHGQAGNTETGTGEGLTIQIFRDSIATDVQYLITGNCTLSYIFTVHIIILNALTENGHLWPHCHIIQSYWYYYIATIIIFRVSI